VKAAARRQAQNEEDDRLRQEEDAELQRFADEQ
jgi:hypothetical protein